MVLPRPGTRALAGGLCQPQLRRFALGLVAGGAPEMVAEGRVDVNPDAAAVPAAIDGADRLQLTEDFGDVSPRPADRFRQLRAAREAHVGVRGEVAKQLRPQLHGLERAPAVPAEVTDHLGVQVGLDPDETQATHPRRFSMSPARTGLPGL